MYVVLCNCPPAEARPIALALVGEGIAACVNVIPAVTSYFEWDGRLEEETESTLIIKAPRENLARLRERIHQLHSYKTVEILAMAVDTEQSDGDYVAWVRALAPR